MKRKHTLHDVADQAGVSYQTVSRVVNDHPNVAAETRERVRGAIAQLGYRPNKLAKSLVAKYSKTLGLLTFGMNQYGPAQMVLNIERAAKDLGYDLIFSNVNEVTHEGIRKALTSLSERQVDGIVSIAPVVGITYAQMAQMSQGIPLVQIDSQMGQDVPSIVVDQHYGSQLVTAHLLALGHRRIAEISGPQHWFGALARHEQWEATMRGAGLTPGSSIAGDWTANSGYQAARHLLAVDPGFTALVVGNDQMALGAIYALHESNLRVPDDVSVVGFDDIPESAFFNPPLTTVRQDFNQLGDISVRYLLERMNQPEVPPQQQILYPRLVVRKSSAPPR